METITISVIMSVYNEPIEWLNMAVESILNQTYRDFEFIIVNDNPSRLENKEVLELIAKRDTRVRIISNEENIGLTKSLNKAIALCKGQYIARMDADDYSYPHRLEIQLRFMQEHPEVDVCGSWCKIFGITHFYSHKIFATPVSHEEIEIYSIFATPILHPVVMAKRDIDFHYNESAQRAQDYELWSQLLTKNKVFHNIEQPLFKYRITAKSRKDDYLRKQSETADIARTTLLEYLLNEKDKEHIQLHNQICNHKIYGCNNIDNVEQWLHSLRDRLYQKYPNKKQYIDTTLSKYWVLSCLSISNYNRCIKSFLMKENKLLTYMKFFKRKL